MAAPAVSGFTARLIAANQATLPQIRNDARVRAILQLVVNSACKLGFPADHEGCGMPH